jgi:CheY-like chemotaxis protein
MTAHPSPNTVHVRPSHGPPFQAALTSIAPSSLWVTTLDGHELPFREPVFIELMADGSVLLCEPAEVITTSPAGIGLELTSAASPRAREALALWARGEPAELSAPKPAVPLPRAATPRPGMARGAAGADLHTQALQAAGDQTPLFGRRVLVIMSDAETARVIERCLVRRGAHVEIDRDGKGAVERARAAEFDTVLLDWLMPKVSGKTVLQSLKKEHPGLRVAIVSAIAARASTRSDLMQVGADAVFSTAQVGEIAPWIALPAPAARRGAGLSSRVGATSST